MGMADPFRVRHMQEYTSICPCYCVKVQSLGMMESHFFLLTLNNTNAFEQQWMISAGSAHCHCISHYITQIDSTHFCEGLDCFSELKKGFGPFYYIGFNAFMTSCPLSMQSLCKSLLSDRTVTSDCQVLEENLQFEMFGFHNSSMRQTF